MNLKRILLLTIAALSLSGSLYGMGERRDGYDRLIDFPGLEKITCEYPYSFFNLVRFPPMENDLEKIKLIIQKNPNIVNIIDPMTAYNNSTLTALDYAIAQNNSDLVETLLTSGNNVQVNIPDKNRLRSAILINCFNDTALNRKKQIIHLLCSAGATMDSNDNQPYSEDRNSIFMQAEESDDEIVEIIRTHINTRLAIAIWNGNTDEARRLITKYNINIDTPLSHYDYYIRPRAIKDPYKRQFIPLHMAASWQNHEMVCMLVNDFNANVNSKDEDGKNVFFTEPSAETARFLISKGGNLHAVSNEGQRPIDTIRWPLTPEGLDELSGDPERIANLRALEEIFEGRSNNNSWKWIGGGAAVVVAVVAAKQLYNWWYKEADVEEEKTEADIENNEVSQDAVKDKATTQK